jgi:Arc/MetJ-type ribon-helix-helix transcriptional regulator
MNVPIDDYPDLQRFIAEQIQSGDFQSAEEVVLAALMVFRDQRRWEDEEEFDDETAAEINAAYERGASGEPGLSIEEVRQRLLANPSLQVTESRNG